jgi:hypothetical protein
MKKLILFFSLFAFLFSLIAAPVLAGPQSTSYEIKDYGFGSGGTDGTNSTNYSMFGTTGEMDTSGISSTNYKTLPGLVYTMQANTPAAPTFTNPSNYYNKLHIVLNTGSNSSDAQFAIAISTDAFVTDVTHYVQADNTIGTTFVWQTNAVWGAAGFDVIGLTPGVTYTIRVAARQGNYTQSPWSATAAVATSNSTMAFTLSPSSISSWVLTPGSVGTAPSTATVTVTTNASNGATVYVSDSKNGLESTMASHTISSVSNDLTAIGEGYGIRATAVSESSGGPMQKIAPYNGTGSTVGIITSTQQIIFDSTGAPVNSGTGTFEIKAKPATTAPPGSDYTDTITVISSAAF